MIMKHMHRNDGWGIATETTRRYAMKTNINVSQQYGFSTLPAKWDQVQLNDSAPRGGGDNSEAERRRKTKASKPHRRKA